jgi:hypothetical protein
MSNERVTDDIISEGFRSLAQTMAEGFDGVRTEIGALRSEMNQRFAESEQRMLRHFDKRDERLDNHEHRITALEPKR